MHPALETIISATDTTRDWFAYLGGRRYHCRCILHSKLVVGPPRPVATRVCLPSTGHERCKREEGVVITTAAVAHKGNSSARTLCDSFIRLVPKLMAMEPDMFIIAPIAHFCTMVIDGMAPPNRLPVDTFGTRGKNAALLREDHTTNCTCDGLQYCGWSPC